MLTPETVYELCARSAHEVNRAYCLAFGDTSQVPWDQAPQWQKDIARSATVHIIEGADAEKTHELWVRKMLADGWGFDLVKDIEKRKHPCLVEYRDMSEQHRRKDELFVQTVLAVLNSLGISRGGLANRDL